MNLTAKQLHISFMLKNFFKYLILFGTIGVVTIAKINPSRLYIGLCICKKMKKKMFAYISNQ